MPSKRTGQCCQRRVLKDSRPQRDRVELLDGREVPKDHCAELHAQITFNFSVAGSGCGRGHIQ